MVKIIFDNENVYVSYGAGELLVQPLTNSWLWVIGAIHDGETIKITDDRKELQDHQYNLSGILAPYEEAENPIGKAIAYCEELIDKYDYNIEITDLDICHVIEILKGRE